MANKIIVHSQFERDFKKLSKKYPSFPQDVRELVNELKRDSQLGTSLGRNLRKIRLRIKSKGSGKSGGARVITYVVIVEETVYLLSAYDKSEQVDISASDLKRLAADIERGL